MIRAIRYTVPILMSVQGANEEETDCVFSAVTNEGEEVEVRFHGAEPVEAPSKNSTVVAKSVQSVCFSVKVSDQHRVNRVDPQRQEQELAKCVLRISNRFFRCLRNYGLCTNVNEVHITADEPRKVLAALHVEYQSQVDIWTVPEEPEDRLGLAMYVIRGGLGFSTGHVTFNASLHRGEVEEAFADDLAPRPEYEYLVNAFEALGMQRIRWAIVEAVIGLEIIVERYLEAYLHQFDLPSDAIARFLSPQLDLYRRVSVLLPSYLGKHDDYLRGERLTAILEAVRQRNSIAHSGALPTLSYDRAETLVLEVMNLTTYLSLQLRQLEEGPVYTAICSETLQRVLGSRFDLQVVLGRRHGVYAQVTFQCGTEFPDRSILEAAARGLAETCKEKDRWLHPSRDLRIAFKDFLGSQEAVWANGRLVTTRRG